ncbi:hypothetical protein OPV22_032159 [Ensete ventricosum]|uniref:Uncharacterized protein n=1 Tax=Ensete ventricosum TaxID=4639 RepID=A0AAV8PQU6_ENSVE|nr:hypothetical protein OPV22_032159 [Ensete ventricosum]
MNMFVDIEPGPFRLGLLNGYRKMDNQLLDTLLCEAAVELQELIEINTQLLQLLCLWNAVLLLVDIAAKAQLELLHWRTKGETVSYVLLLYCRGA